MIDLEKAKQAFKNYVNHYDVENRKIKLKIRHTYQVVDMSEYIAKDLELSEGQIQLAKLIGLLHDIGRFEQLKRFNSFDDAKTIDHAEFSANLLFQKGLIHEFIEDRSYDFVIEKAIRNHNRYQIEDGLSGETLLQSKIIRDADKADNYYVKSYEPFEILYDKSYIGDEEISDEVYEDFLNRKCILRDKRKTNIDSWICFMAFLFDFNFKSGLKWIKENDYINRLSDRIDCQNERTKERMKIIQKTANDYIEERLNTQGQ